MKKINRFKVLFALWAVLIAYCAFISTNVYFDVTAIFLGILLFIGGVAYIEENMNEKEERFFNNFTSNF